MRCSIFTESLLNAKNRRLLNLVARSTGEAAASAFGTDHDVRRTLAASGDADGIFGANCTGEAKRVYDGLNFFTRKHFAGCRRAIHLELTATRGHRYGFRLRLIEIASGSAACRNRANENGHHYLLTRHIVLLGKGDTNSGNSVFEQFVGNGCDDLSRNSVRAVGSLRRNWIARCCSSDSG
jgi:hypothetical protein